MAVEVITIVPANDQSIDSVFAFAKSLMIRGVSAGQTREGDVVKIFMLPPTAGRYATGHPTFLEDRDAVMNAIKAAGYKIQDGLGSAAETDAPKPAAPASTPAPKPAVKA